MEVVAAGMEEMGRNDGRARRPCWPQPRWPGQRPPAWRAAPAVQREGEQAGEKCGGAAGMEAGEERRREREERMTGGAHLPCQRKSPTKPARG